MEVMMKSAPWFRINVENVWRCDWKRLRLQIQKNRRKVGLTSSYHEVRELHEEDFKLGDHIEDEPDGNGEIMFTNLDKDEYLEEYNVQESKDIEMDMKVG